MCFKKRKHPLIGIYVLSGLALVFGICMIAFAAALTNNSVLENMEKESSAIKDARELLFLVLLIFSLMTMFVAGLGLLLRCVKNRCCVVSYACLLFPSFIIVMVFGAICTAVAIAADETIADECVDLSEYTSYSSNTLEYSFDVYATLRINEYMCTDYCPCKTTSHDAKYREARRLHGKSPTHEKDVPSMARLLQDSCTARDFNGLCCSSGLASDYGECCQAGEVLDFDGDCCPGELDRNNYCCEASYGEYIDSNNDC